MKNFIRERHSQEGLNRYKEIDLIPTSKVQKYDCFSLSKGIINRTGYIFLSKEFISDDFDLEELEVLIAHELHHLKSDTVLLALARSLSKISLFGSGLLASAVDFSSREYLADRYAAEEFGRENVINTLEKVNKWRKAASMLRGRENQYQPVGLSFSTTIEAELGEQSSLKKVYKILFSNSFIPSYIHPSLDERKKCLEEMEVG